MTCLLFGLDCKVQVWRSGGYVPAEDPPPSAPFTLYYGYSLTFEWASLDPQLLRDDQAISTRNPPQQAPKHLRGRVHHPLSLMDKDDDGDCLEATFGDLTLSASRVGQLTEIIMSEVG